MYYFQEDTLAHVIEGRFCLSCNMNTSSLPLYSSMSYKKLQQQSRFVMNSWSQQLFSQRHSGQTDHLYQKIILNFHSRLRHGAAESAFDVAPSEAQQRLTFAFSSLTMVFRSRCHSCRKGVRTVAPKCDEDCIGPCKHRTEPMALQPSELD